MSGLPSTGGCSVSDWNRVEDRKREVARFRLHFEGTADLISNKKVLREREESKLTFRLWT